MTTHMPYITGLSMLSPAQMRAASARYEMAPCQWLWNDYTHKGPNLLNRFITLCCGMDEYLKESLFRPEMNEVLRHYGRTDFDHVPSQEAIVGLAVMWGNITNILEAESSFCALMDDENRPLDAALKFLSMRATLELLRRAIQKEPCALGLWYWLGRIGWDELLALADQRDHAARELIAGRAFCGAEGGIAVLPSNWSSHAAA